MLTLQTAKSFMMKDSATSLETLKAYYTLTKPGIIRGNVLTAIAGFFYASQGTVVWATLAYLLGGVVCVIASACVVNNYFDRTIDAKMERTKKRALVTGRIAAAPALAYATGLAVVGFGLLLVGTNALTVISGVLAFVTYAGVYTYAKHRTVYGTLIGSFPGALSLVAGYVAVTGSLNSTALILFAIMAVWQMPHFYAIAIYRKAEYAAAGVPVFSIVKGTQRTIWHIIGYIAAFGAVAVSLSIVGDASLTYGVIMAGLSVWWLWYALKGLRTKKVESWAKGVFGISLVTLLVFSLLLTIDNFLP